MNSKDKLNLFRTQGLVIIQAMDLTPSFQAQMLATVWDSQGKDNLKGLTLQEVTARAIELVSHLAYGAGKPSWLDE